MRGGIPPENLFRPEKILVEEKETWYRDAGTKFFGPVYHYLTGEEVLQTVGWEIPVCAPPDASMPAGNPCVGWLQEGHPLLLSGRKGS